MSRTIPAALTDNDLKQPRSYQLGFIVEQALGHATHGQNLQEAVAHDQSVHPAWAFPDQSAAGLAGKIPNWTVSAGLQARHAIRNMQRQCPTDALFFHTQVTAALCLDWLRRIPSVISLDATPLQYDALGEFYAHEAGSGWVEQRKWRLNQACFQAAHHLITWSDWAKASLIADYDISADKITTIPPGVDPFQWQRPPAYIDNNDPARPVRILFVGGNLARKGGLLLLEAFQHLRERLEIGDWRLEETERLGDWETTYEQSLNLPVSQSHFRPRSSAPLLPHPPASSVELHLVTKDPVAPQPGVFVYNDMEPNSAALKQLFWDSDIFCLPTLGDCLPMVLSEAGAAELPLVASRVAAIPEIVRDGETGLLVTPGNVEELTVALQWLVTNPEWRRQLGQQAASTVRQKFDSRKNAQQLLSLLKQIVDDHS